jgi:hypothetical protein
MTLLTHHAFQKGVGGVAVLSGMARGNAKTKLPLKMLKPQGQLKPNTESPKKRDDQHNKASKSPPAKLHRAVPVLLGGTALASFIFPAPAVFAAADQVITAAASPQFSHTYHMIDDHTMCTGCMVLGITFSCLTLAFTCRFLLSFFPNLERAARQHQGPLPLRACLMLDGVLDPIQRNVFQMKEEGDPNYAAMLYLALMSGVLEVLFGPSGLLFHSVPDIQILKGLDYLIMWQQMLLLPQWTMAVFRFFGLI